MDQAEQVRAAYSWRLERLPEKYHGLTREGSLEHTALLALQQAESFVSEQGLVELMLRVDPYAFDDVGDGSAYRYSHDVIKCIRNVIWRLGQKEKIELEGCRGKWRLKK